jgi:hypothetical protein
MQSAIIISLIFLVILGMLFFQSRTSGKTAKTVNEGSSLNTCPDCKHPISSKAETCPNCGCPVVLCPHCGALGVQKVHGLYGTRESITAFVLCFCYLIPGIAYYIYMENIPFCPSCRRRVWRKIKGDLTFV